MEGTAFVRAEALTECDSMVSRRLFEAIDDIVLGEANASLTWSTSDIVDPRKALVQAEEDYRDTPPREDRTESETRSLPHDVLCTIASYLRLQDFVTLVTLGKQDIAHCEEPFFGKAVIREMSVAVSGQEIFEATLKLPAVRPHLRCDLALAFARKTATVALRNQSVLTDAWMRIVDDLPECSNTQALLIRHFASFSDDLSLFRGRHLEREMARLPLQEQYIVLCGLHKPHAIFCRPYVLAFVRAAEHFPTAPHFLAKRLGQSLFEDGQQHNLSDVLCLKFGLSVDAQRRHLDPFFVRYIANRADDIARACERWRPGDSAFLRMTENAFVERWLPALFMNDERLDPNRNFYALCDPRLARYTFAKLLERDLDAVTIGAIMGDEDMSTQLFQ